MTRRRLIDTVRIFGTTIGIVAAAAQCVDGNLAGPLAAPPNFTPLASVLPPGAITVMLPLGHSATTDASSSAGTFSRMLVDITITGIITGTFNQQPTRAPIYLDPSGILEAGATCYVNVSLNFSVTGSFKPAPCLSSNTGQTASFTYKHVIVQGAGTVIRNPAIPTTYLGACANPCVYYDGTTTVTITPVASALVLLASPTLIKPADSVHFTAGTTGTVQPVVTKWTYVPDDGSASLSPCGGGVNPCTTTAIVSSGIMYVTATINGVSEQAATHIDVQCPLGDSNLDDFLVRSGIGSVWNASDPSNPNLYLRREHVFVVLKDQSGQLSVRDLTYLMGSTNCATNLPILNTTMPFWSYFPGYTLVAIGHTHPDAAGTYLMVCPPPPWNPDQPPQYTGWGPNGPYTTLLDGPGVEDLLLSIIQDPLIPNSVKLNGQPIVNYVIDPDSVYRFRLGTQDWSHKFDHKEPSGCS